MKGHVKDRLRSYGVYERLGDASFHPTVGMAVRAYLFAPRSVGRLGGRGRPRKELPSLTAFSEPPIAAPTPRSAPERLDREVALARVVRRR